VTICAAMTLILGFYPVAPSDVIPFVSCSAATTSSLDDPWRWAGATTADDGAIIAFAPWPWRFAVNVPLGASDAVRWSGNGNAQRCTEPR